MSPGILLYHTPAGWLFQSPAGTFFRAPLESQRGLTAREDLPEYALWVAAHAETAPAPERLLLPLESQEVWAAGVTYYRSRTARMSESRDAGGGSFYDRVYNAERPELFPKASAHRVVGPDDAVRIRRDSRWNVPEPELSVLVSPARRLLGYTIGNDMSSRDIEGENPLYLPQAKNYDGSCAIGPALLVTTEPLPPSTRIGMTISRSGVVVFDGATTLAQMKRTLADLVEYLYRETSFPGGALLLTGTGVVPPDRFTLEAGDRIAITIDGIGTLRNFVEMRS